jgi:hypothetical protein
VSRRAVVTGMIATFPFGGVAWDYGQYAVGLQRLGFDVVYLEDIGYPMWDPTDPDYAENPEYGVAFAAESLKTLSPEEEIPWHVRARDGRTFGITRDELLDAVAEADVFLNVSVACQLREEYLAARNKIAIDTDPAWNHYTKFPQSLQRDGDGGIAAVTRHDAFFTYAENVAEPDCPLPSFGVDWTATRPPVVLDLWAPEPPAERWTTVLSWANFTEKVVSPEGAEYGSKEREFPMIEELPARSPAPLEIAAGGVNPPYLLWRDQGWHVVDSTSISRTADDYRHYIQQSRGELSVAKNAYVATRTGWFSCRSACYLAASRPVILQDTAFSRSLPTGEGLLTFTSTNEALTALRDVESDYERHCSAARNVATEHLASDRVLGDLLNRAGVL